MKAWSSSWKTALAALALVSGVVLLAGGTAAAGPVDVAVQVTGTPVFGATVTVKATITINDSSTLQSIAWSQTGGVAATLADTATDTVSVTLGSRTAYREQLIHVLGLPPSESVDEDTFTGGLQNRFGVIGASPFALEHAAAVELNVAVVTSSGTYNKVAEVVAALPWKPGGGIRNVPVGLPVVLHGKAQASYNWAMTKPTSSAASLADATTQNPEFTPDAAGTYQLIVTDVATGNPVIIPVIAGLWRGVITGQDGNGRPTVESTCTQCHSALPRIEKFTPWAQTGHAEIFTQNVDTPNGHYSTSCLSCHTVGYDTSATNGGMDDAPDFAGLLASNLVTHGDPANWTNILAQFPQSAKLANIQCENCHGPQDSAAHYQGNGARTTLSADMCGACHGEPARHGRFQQWQTSGHANYEVAESEGTNPTCAKCHSAQGFLQWLPILTGQTPGDPNANLNVTWTADEVHPQTCQVCHDPHAIGTTSGGPTTNATVRISGDTPMLMAGFQATNVGRGAICMTCHNGRRGLRNDSTYNPTDGSRAPHVGPQADIIMGQNLYLVDVGTRSNHSMIEDACVTCHMEKTPPPADLSYNLGGTNHSFAARNDICSKCHSTITTESVQGVVEAKMAALKAAMEQGISNLMAAQIAQGKKIDVGGLATITSMSQIGQMDFEESHGRQGIAVKLADGTQLAAVAMNSVKAVPPVGSATELYRLGDQALPKAGWNYFMIESDASKGVHNPTFVKQALDVSIYAVTHIATTTPGGDTTGKNGGPGTGVGAVSCTTPYVYWAEIAAHNPGTAGSQWRTDMVARNLATSAASLRFILHAESANFEGTGSVPAAGQSAFEDVVAALGQSNAKGALEICSDKPLLVLGRIFNQGGIGTYGQFLDGHVANLGLGQGETASLIGLRQQVDQFRTNLSVTNAGTADADIVVTLYDSSGTQLTAYNLAVPAGKVVQDLKPFEARAGKPDLGWGFATVKVNSGSNIQTSASVIDMKTNDPVTIPGKQ